MSTDLHPSDTLENLRKAFPRAARIGTGEAIPRDDRTGQRVVVKVKAAGTPGYTQPWGLTRETRQGKRYYRAEWLDTGNRAYFTRKRDADFFIDLHRYAEGVRRITDALPAWATTA